MENVNLAKTSPKNRIRFNNVQQREEEFFFWDTRQTDGREIFSDAKARKLCSSDKKT